MPDADPPDDDAPAPATGLDPRAEDRAPGPEGVAPREGAPAGAVEQRARLAEDRLAEVLAAYRTLKNENEEFRERQSRNLERRYEQRRERLLLKFIDVLDNLDRALEAAQTSYAGQPLLEGMILVRTQLLQTLQDEGLERIPVLGLPFDPAVSESVGTEPVPESEQHHIVMKELMRGYRLNGRIARPSRVVIGVFQGPQGTRPEPSAAAAPGGSPPAEASQSPTPSGPSDQEVSTAETTKLPVPTLPPPAEPPPVPSPPRRKGR